MPAFKEEQILIIAPGSLTTLAQLGLPESYTPARWRFPSRMFPGANDGDWEPHRISTSTTTVNVTVNDSATNGEDVDQPPDTQMTDISTADTLNGDITTQSNPLSNAPVPSEEVTTTTFQDDLQQSEGAVYPIQGGRIVDYPCLFALLTHIYNTIAPSFHTAVLLVSQPCWSARDHEILTQFFFEHFKIPAFSIIDAALTAIYAYGAQTAIVVDVGYEKCDISTVTDFAVNEFGRAPALQGCGGRAMTQRLQQLLQDKGFSEVMAEELKRSAICEILPGGASLPKAMQNGEVVNPAAAVSTGAVDSGPNAKDIEGQRPGQAPRGPGEGTDVGEEGGVNIDDDDNEGVLDVAAIVAKDNAAELLAKREQEKAAKDAAKKGRAQEAARPARLKNSEKEKATYTYEEAGSQSATNGTEGEQKGKRKREIEIGVERFMAATSEDGGTDGVLDKIAATIHSTVLTYPDPSQRSALWENVIVLGQGSKIKGFTPALLSTLATRYTLSPSTATMFTSELPSNFSTPLATTPGTNTPVPGMQPHPLHHPAAHGVNPLLVAATRSQMQPQPTHLQVPHTFPQDLQHQQQHSHKQHSQTPIAIKTVKPPDYFPAWKDINVSGMEEAGFLGAQVAAKVLFASEPTKSYMSRVEFNEVGPVAIHEYAM